MLIVFLQHLIVFDMYLNLVELVSLLVFLQLHLQILVVLIVLLVQLCRQRGGRGARHQEQQQREQEPADSEEHGCVVLGRKGPFPRESGASEGKVARPSPL